MKQSLMKKMAAMVVVLTMSLNVMAADDVQAEPWQTCTCIGQWHYSQRVYEQSKYKSAATVVRMLVDIVSKNGNLLLSIPVKGDGTIAGKAQAMW